MLLFSQSYTACWAYSHVYSHFSIILNWGNAGDIFALNTVGDGGILKRPEIKNNGGKNKIFLNGRSVELSCPLYAIVTFAACSRVRAVVWCTILQLQIALRPKHGWAKGSKLGCGMGEGFEARMWNGRRVRSPDAEWPKDLSPDAKREGPKVRGLDAKWTKDLSPRCRTVERFKA